MSGSNLQHLAAMIVYMAAVIGIGLYFSKRANRDTEAYFLGGRSLGPWVTAFSAEASDMSGYLLMGIPGLAYWTGLADAGWTCIGLALGTYFNFLIVSKRLRRYSVAVDAFTIPDFFSNRFHEKKKVLMTISSVIIIIFFAVYAAQCLSSCGKLFANLFGLSYGGMMIVAAVFVLAYTFLGGFLAESASDFMQAVVMITVLVLILVLSVSAAGGLNAVIDNAKSFDGYFSLTQTSTPSDTEINAFGAAKPYGGLTIISMLAWGLGYFGMPQVLLRFMGIRSEKELGRSRRVQLRHGFHQLGRWRAGIPRHHVHPGLQSRMGKRLVSHQKFLRHIRSATLVNLLEQPVRWRQPNGRSFRRYQLTTYPPTNLLGQFAYRLFAKNCGC